MRKIRYANGTESIELLDGTRLDVVAATRDGSRGRTADYLWIDELREISEEAFQAATPVTRARANAQALYTTNAGDAFSTVLNSIIERARSYPPKSLNTSAKFTISKVTLSITCKLLTPRTYFGSQRS